MNFDIHQFNTADLIQAISIAIGVLFFIYSEKKSGKRDKTLANREIYQRLELAAIDLFRFEADHEELIKPFWQKKKMPKPNTVKFNSLMNYLCQNLNLFEMALRFRRNNVFDPEIFGSWVAWYFLILNAPGFPVLWNEVKHDYLPNLRKIFDNGLQILELTKDQEEQQKLFYGYVADLLNCKKIEDWLNSNDKDNSLDLYLAKRKKGL